MVPSYRGIEAPQLDRECSHPLPHQEVGVLKDAQAAHMERSHSPELSQAFTLGSPLPGDCMAMSPRRAMKSCWGGEVLWRAMGPLATLAPCMEGLSCPTASIALARLLWCLPLTLSQQQKSYVAAN